MKRGLLPLAVLALAWIAPACRPKAASAPSPETVSVPSPEPRRVAYRPPPGGKVTVLQVEMYLSVLDKLRLDRRVAGRPPSPPAGDALVLTPPDVAAARDRKLNTEEYLWVKERILEAEAAIMAARLNANVTAMIERTLGELKAKRADAADEASKKLLSEQIASFEAEGERVRKEAREKEPESIRANVKTIEPYRERLAGADQILEPSSGGETGKKAAAAKARP